MTAESNIITYSEAIAHQFMQIRIAERSIQEAREMGSDLLVRQYQKLKNEFIQQLNEMLKANMLGLKVIEDV